MGKLHKRTLEYAGTFIMASIFKKKAMEATKSKTIRLFLRRSDVKYGVKCGHIGIPHHWALAYHDGWSGGVKKGRGKFWIFLPQRLDPRRPRRAMDEVHRNQVRKMTRDELRRLKKRFGNQVKIITKRRGWFGDPFFVRASQHRYEDAHDAIEIIIADEIDRLTAQTFKMAYSRHHRSFHVRNFQSIGGRQVGYKVGYIKVRTPRSRIKGLGDVRDRI